ncbi:Polycystic kidney disease protein 1-like 2 [Nymphon striatum]|nr:Polycystic kidney disease protein 1-like 2 [Nymphon striatum]
MLTHCLLTTSFITAVNEKFQFSETSSGQRSVEGDKGGFKIPYNGSFQLNTTNFINKNISFVFRKITLVNEYSIHLYITGFQLMLIVCNNIFHTAHPDIEKFYIYASMDQSSSKLCLKVNKPPVNGTCNVTSVDNCLMPKILLTCDNNWYDPDVIESIKIDVIDSDGARTTVEIAENFEMVINILYDYCMIRSLNFGKTFVTVTVANPVSLVKIGESHENFNVLESYYPIQTYDYKIYNEMCKPELEDVESWLTTIQNQGDPAQINTAIMMINEETTEEINNLLEKLSKYNLKRLEHVSPDSSESEKIKRFYLFQETMKILELLESSDEIAESSINALQFYFHIVHFASLKLSRLLFPKFLKFKVFFFIFYKVNRGRVKRIRLKVTKFNLCPKFGHWTKNTPSWIAKHQGQKNICSHLSHLSQLSSPFTPYFLKLHICSSEKIIMNISHPPIGGTWLTHHLVYRRPCLYIYSFCSFNFSLSGLYVYIFVFDLTKPLVFLAIHVEGHIKGCRSTSDFQSLSTDIDSVNNFGEIDFICLALRFLINRNIFIIFLKENTPTYEKPIDDIDNEVVFAFGDCICLTGVLCLSDYCRSSIENPCNELLLETDFMQCISPSFIPSRARNNPEFDNSFYNCGKYQVSRTFFFIILLNFSKVQYTVRYLKSFFRMDITQFSSMNGTGVNGVVIIAVTVLSEDQTSTRHRCAMDFFDVMVLKFIPPENETNWIVVLQQFEGESEYKLAVDASDFEIYGLYSPLTYIFENPYLFFLLYPMSYFDYFLKQRMKPMQFTYYIEFIVLNQDNNKSKVNFENITADEAVKSFKYLLNCATTRCGFYNKELNEWQTSGIEVESIEVDGINCRSNHMTTFGSGFFVKPNTIDFDYVFANANIEDNITIYLTVIISFVIYILLLIWARHKDKKDKEKIGATPLPDNNSNHKYLYEIILFTGSKVNSGTESKVRFIVTGELGDTGVRPLVDEERKVLQTNGIDSFVMTTKGPLGNLRYLRIWHDNSGKGKKASWYLDFIVIRDVHTGKKYEFLAHKWFAVELDDGAIERMLPVSGEDELSEFSHLFSASSSRNLRDGHLWLSIFTRPPRSRFTRTQRVSSCMALLYLSMLANIMWYGTVSQKPTSGMKLGPFVLSPAQIGVGLISNLIVFPPSLLIITLFRKSRRKLLRPSRITEALNRGNTDTMSGSQTCLTGTVNNNKKKRVRPKKFTFPFWCVYIAWALTVICIGVSLFFLWAYGITFGNDKTTKWFTSLIVSFLCSIFLTQPIKVMLVTLLLSMVCKNINQDEDDADEDEEEPELADDEEWTHTAAGFSKKSNLPDILNSKEVMNARERREKEVKMYAIAREILSYLFFLWILLTISYGNRDPNAIMLKNTITNAYLKPGHLDYDFDKRVKSPQKLYDWMREVFIKEIIVGKWYNNELPFDMLNYMNDHSNLLVGVPLLRQVRVKENSCYIHPSMWNITQNCGGYGNLINEQKEDFREGWTKDSEFRELYEFLYQSSFTLKSLPFWGILDWYGGGGYVFPFIPPLFGKERKLQKLIDRLERNDWIDKSTRAVFVEFSVYNSQVNLYAMVTIVAEFQPGVLKLQRYHTDFGLFTMICEVMFFIYIIYFTVIEIKQFMKEKKRYFGQIPNFIDLALIIFAYFAIGLFINREILTMKVMEIFKETEGKGYVRLQHVAAIDELLGYMIAFLVFFANMKFLHLLRFNKRLGILSTTLKDCAADLSSFGVCLLIVFLAFVQLFYLILGLHVSDYATFINSLEATFSMMLGKFKFIEISMAAPIIGPLVFFIFGLATSLILINILLTIVIRTFEEVKHDMNKIPNDYEMVDFIVNKVRTVIGLGKKAKVHPEVDSTKDSDENKDVRNFPQKVDKLLGYINNVYFGERRAKSRTGGILTRKRKKPDILKKTDDSVNNAQHKDI